MKDTDKKAKAVNENEKKRIAIMILILICVIAFLAAGIYCIILEFTKDKSSEGTSSSVGSLEDGDNEYVFDSVVVTDEDGKVVTDENGKEVTEQGVYREVTDKNGNVVKIPIDDNGNPVTDKDGNEVTINTGKKRTTTTRTNNNTTNSGKIPTTESTKASKTTTAKSGGEETTNKEYTTLPTSKDKVPSTSASGTKVTFSSKDQQALKSMLEVPYLYTASYENSDGVPISIANHAALWMASREGMSTNTYASGTIVLDLFKYFGQTVVNYKTNCNGDKNENIQYVSSSDTFYISNFEKSTHTVSITSIEKLGNNNYYKVTAKVSGTKKASKVVAVVQKNQLDSSLGFSIKALKWS